MEPSGEFKRLLESVHREITLIDYNEMKVPCVIVKRDRFEEIMKAFYGRPQRVNANLNILHDDQKHVFVEILLNFANLTPMKVLLYANETLEFFEHMAASGMIALVPEHVEESSANIFMVQLPRRDSIERALELIRSYL
jgi:hypothetical protein